VTDEKYHHVGERFQWLAEMESLAEGGWQELYILVRSTLQRLNQEAGADLLEVRPPEYEGGDWTVAFRTRNILQFRVSTGGTEQAAGAIATCLVEKLPPSLMADLPIATFYYIKTDDRCEWGRVVKDRTERSDEPILDVIAEYVDTVLRAYPRR
jgi:hypothetical protein